MELLNSFWGSVLVLSCVGGIGVIYFLIKDMCDDLSE